VKSSSIYGHANLYSYTYSLILIFSDSSSYKVARWYGKYLAGYIFFGKKDFAFTSDISNRKFFFA